MLSCGSYGRLVFIFSIFGWCYSGVAVGLEIDVDEAVLEKVVRLYSIEAKERVAGWGTLLRSERADTSLSDRQKMESANRYFNQVKWLSDQEHWGQEDYWATPIETLATNGGDCEDYSIGKYFTLLQTRVDQEKLRITYVKSLTYNQAHMVLAYYETPDAEPLILDNINGEILPASQREDLFPVYSFNGKNIWLAKSRGKKLKGDSMKSLPKWRGVNERILNEFNLPSGSSAGP